MNSACHDFFRDTLQTLDESLVRPQFPGYMAFQNKATPVAHDCVKGGISPAAAAAEINSIYRNSLKLQQP